MLLHLWFNPPVAWVGEQQDRDFPLLPCEVVTSITSDRAACAMPARREQRIILQEKPRRPIDKNRRKSRRRSMSTTALLQETAAKIARLAEDSSVTEALSCGEAQDTYAPNLETRDTEGESEKQLEEFSIRDCAQGTAELTLFTERPSLKEEQFNELANR